MKFLDETKIYVKSGDGGAGCVSFHREKYVEFGGPDGGNGGRGGHIYFEAVNNLNTLIDFRYQQHFKAKTGIHGMGRNKTGRNGEDLIIKVPVGTQILDEDKETVLADFTKEGERILFLKGGDGGFGNAHYKSSTNQAPRKNTPGWPGQETGIWLRLKLIADAGLLGLPNAGKSTFLSSVSNAKPKIADYPFTTLHPNLGVIKIDSYDFVMADIPGLIEGASDGVGLGHRFLGHVERSKILLHLIDGTADDVVENYNIIRNELEKYDTSLIDKDEIIALNKIDALTEEEINKKVSSLEKETKKKVFAISAATQLNVKPVLYKIASYTSDSHPDQQKKQKDDRETNTSYDPSADI